MESRATIRRQQTSRGRGQRHSQRNILDQGFRRPVQRRRKMVQLIDGICQIKEQKSRKSLHVLHHVPQMRQTLRPQLRNSHGTGRIIRQS